MSTEARMSLSNVSQDYSFCACPVLGKWPSTTDYRIAVARIRNITVIFIMFDVSLFFREKSSSRVRRTRRSRPSSTRASCPPSPPSSGSIKMTSSRPCASGSWLLGQMTWSTRGTQRNRLTLEEMPLQKWVVSLLLPSTVCLTRKRKNYHPFEILWLAGKKKSSILCFFPGGGGHRW